MKYSIILPCYNVAKYLNRCLDSIYSNNNISDCEVILVDDGSTDNFKKICKKYFDVTDELLAKSESEFEFGGGYVQIISQENCGVSAARNMGMRKAKGEYILFVDPDDYVMQGLLESLDEKLNTAVFDMILYGFVEENQIRNSVQNILPKIENDILSNKEAIEKLFPQYIGYSVEHVKNWLHTGEFNPKKEWGSVWRVAYRREFLIENKILFDSKIVLNEDGIFNALCISRAEKIGTINKCLYYYIVRTTGSMSQRMKENLVQNKLALLEARENITSKMEKSSENIFAGSTVFSIFELMATSNLQSWNSIQRYIHHPLVQSSIKVMPIGVKFKYTVPIVLLKLKWNYFLFLSIQLCKKIGVSLNL